MTHVPYKGGAGPAVADVIGGHVELMFVTISSAIQHVRGGRLKALAVTTPERNASLPDVPTMSELGFKNNVSASWQGMLVPAKTPRPIVDKIHAAIVHAMSDQTVKDRIVAGRRAPGHQQVAGGIQGLSRRRGDEMGRGGQGGRRAAGLN